MYGRTGVRQHINNYVCDLFLSTTVSRFVCEQHVNEPVPRRGVSCEHESTSYVYRFHGNVNGSTCFVKTYFTQQFTYCINRAVLKNEGAGSDDRYHCPATYPKESTCTMRQRRYGGTICYWFYNSDNNEYDFYGRRVRGSTCSERYGNSLKGKPVILFNASRAGCFR